MFKGGLRLIIGLAGATAVLALSGCGDMPAAPAPQAPTPAATAPTVFIGASLFGVPLDADSAGGRIEFLLPAGPAEAAGLRESDIVTTFGGKPIHTTAELVAALKDIAPGTAVAVTAVRDVQPITVEVRPEARPADFDHRCQQAIAGRIENEEEAEAKRAYRRA